MQLLKARNFNLNLVATENEHYILNILTETEEQLFSMYKQV